MKSGNLNSLEPSGPLQACNGTALPLPLLFLHVCIPIVYLCIFIVPAGTLRLPSLRFILAFSSVVKTNARLNPGKTGTASTLPNFCVVLCIVCFAFCVLFVLCCSVHCFCVVLCIVCFALFCVLFVLCCSAYCLFCVVLCTVCFVLYCVLFVLCCCVYCLFCVVLCIVCLAFCVLFDFVLFCVLFVLCCSVYCLFCVVLCIVIVCVCFYMVYCLSHYSGNTTSFTIILVCVCVCVYMCTVLLPPGGYPTALNKYVTYHNIHLNGMLQTSS